MNIRIILYTLLLFSFLGQAQSESSLDSSAVFSMQNDSNKVRAWLELSDETVRVNFNKSKAYGELALALATKIDYQKGIYMAHESIGRAATYQSDNKTAFEHYKTAYEYYKSTGNKKREAACLNRMGETMRLLDEYEHALTYFQLALDLNRELGDSNEMGSCYIGIGILYVMQGNMEEAEGYFLEAIDMFRSIGNASREHLTMLNLGGLYRDNGKYEKSIELSEKARDYFLANGPEIRAGIALYNLGVAYFQMDKLDESRHQYQEAVKIFEKLGDKMRIYGINMRLSEIALKKGDLDVALEQARLGLAGFEELQNMSQEVWAYKQMSAIYTEKGDYKQALDYRIKYEEMRDSINNVETKERIAELEEKYQSELKDQELDKANAEIELNALILQKQQVQKYIFLGVSVFSLVIILLLYNQYRVKLRNNDTLRSKNKLIRKSLGEKEVLLKEIHHRVKNNLQFISSLLNLQSRFVKDPQTLAVLIEGRNRIQSMALVHQKLYQEENLKGVHMSSYVKSLVEGLEHSFKVDRSRVSVEVDVQDIHLDVDTAIPVGMILNELITNVFKYAFDADVSGRLEVSLKENNGALVLLVKDDGRGLPKGFDQNESKGFGFELVESLAEKIKGKLEVMGGKGTSITVKIENFKTA